jgi:epoxyqueuosine reductase
VSDESYFEPRDKIIDNTDEDWNNLNQSDFSTIFKKSAIKRTKFSGLKRNIDNNNKMKKTERIKNE